MKRLAALLFLVPALALSQAAQDLSTKLDEVFAPWNRSDGPGGVVGVVKDGKLIYHKGFGLANLEHKAPMKPDSVVDVGSVSKMFTAACVILLEQDGKLDLDDPIQKHIPEVPTYEDKITLRHLIHHTSGMRDYLTLMMLKGMSPLGPMRQEEVLNLISRQQGLNFKPGTSWNYCNTGYFLLGRVVEEVSGKTLNEFADERIFTPLGMENTRYWDAPTYVIPNRATSYRKSGDDWMWMNSTLSISGEGGLHTTVSDMAKWDANFRSGKVGGKAFITEMETASQFPQGPMNYASGLMVDKLGEVTRIHHGGDWLGYNAQYSRFPEKGVSVFSFGTDGTQLGKTLNDKAARLVLGLPMPDDGSAASGGGAVKLTAEQKARFVGHYEISLGAQTLAMEVILEDGKLFVHPVGQPKMEVETTGEKELSLDAANAKFAFDEEEAGFWTRGVLDQNGVKLPFRRKAPYVPTEEDYNRVIGRWFCYDLDVVFEFKRVDDGLVIDHPIFGEDKVILAEDSIKFGLMTWKFDKEKAKVDNLLLDAGRATNILFERL